MQTSVKTVLHTTSETKLDYCMKKSTSGYEHDAGCKEYILTVYMCTVFRLMINSCKIMQDSKSHAITQTIHTNLVGLFCDAGYFKMRSFPPSLQYNVVKITGSIIRQPSGITFQHCLRGGGAMGGIKLEN